MAKEGFSEEMTFNLRIRLEHLICLEGPPHRRIERKGKGPTMDISLEFPWNTKHSSVAGISQGSWSLRGGRGWLERSEDGRNQTTQRLVRQQKETGLCSKTN